MSVQAGPIGARLRAGRERKGLTVLQAAEKMHVDPKILESLEAEDFDALGAPVYVKGHLRHYAELLGEASTELQALYSNSIRVTQPDLTRIPKVAISSDPSRLVVPATVVLIAFAIAGGVWWVLTLSKAHPPSASKSVPLAASATPVAPPAASVVTAPETPVAGSGSRSGGPGASGAAHTASTGGAATHAPGAAVPAPPTARATPAAAAPSAVGAGAPSAAAAPRAGRQAEVTLRFSAESWAEVYDSSGERLFYDVGPADSVRTFKGTPPLRVVLGNAPGVAVEVNGRVTDLANLTHTDGSAQFVVSRAGRVSQSP
jgi:cytoskeleton protein RodZ